MLEIKPFKDWSASTPTADNATKLRDYTDYVRSSYFKNEGSITADTEQEIFNGVANLSAELGVITEEDDEETATQKINDIYGTRTTSKDADAQFVLDHLVRGGSKESMAEDQANALRRYLAIKETQPQLLESDPDLLGLVDTITQDKSLVRDARIAAVDRGDVQVVAVDEEGGRQVYAGANTNRETVTGKLDSLLASGAITTTDLGQVGHLASPNASGRGTIADDMMFNTFANTMKSLAEEDEDLAESLKFSAQKMRRSKEVGAMDAGDVTFEAGKALLTPLAVLPDMVGSLFGVEKPETKTPASADAMVRNLDVFREKGYTEDQIERFTKDYLLRSGGTYYKADKPETGIEADSLGNVIVDNALVPNKVLFEKALESGGFTEGQKKQASDQRLAQLEENAPAMRRLILRENMEAVGAYAAAKAAGKTEAQFVEDWVSDPDNYSAFTERVQQFGQLSFNSVFNQIYGVGALAGDEGSAKMLGTLNKELSDREEYMSMFGDRFGFVAKVINVVPQVATDILATAGTGGVALGLKALTKAGTNAVIRGATKNAVSSLVAKETAAALRLATTAGAEATVPTAFRSVGAELAKGLTKTEAAAALFSTSFVRSAGSSYGSIYAQLPETMSHEEKHKNAVGYAITSGLSTAVIVTAMVALGRGGVESIGTRMLTRGDDAFATMSPAKLSQLTYKQAKALYDDVNFAGKSVPGEFNKALRANVGGAYKNYVRTVFKGAVDEGFEEALDTAIQIKIEDAALKKDTPLSDQLSQIFEAAMIGGVLGGASPSVSQLVGKPTMSDLEAAESARMDLYGRIAKTLRATDSSATAAVVEREINAGREKSMQRRAEELTKTEAAAERAKTTLAPNTESEPFDAGDTPPADPTAPPTPTEMIGDFVGERASMEGFSGTLQMVDGVVVLQLDEAVDGNEFFEVGSAQLPLKKSGVSLNRKRLSVLKQDRGKFPAGTPFVNPNPGKKDRYALSPDRSTVEMWRPSEGDPYLRVRIFKVDGNQESSRMHTITDPDIIQDVLKYYKLTMPDTESDPVEEVGDLFPESGTPEVTQAPAAPKTVARVTTTGRARMAEKILTSGGVDPESASVIATAIATAIDPDGTMGTEEFRAKVMGEFKARGGDTAADAQIFSEDPAAYFEVDIYGRSPEQQAQVGREHNAFNAQQRLVKNRELASSLAGVEAAPEVTPEVATEAAPEAATEPEAAAPIRKGNGEPFANETTARASLKRLKLDPESYDIVPVEGGFEATLKVAEPAAEQPPAQTTTPEVESAQPSAQRTSLQDKVAYMFTGVLENDSLIRLVYSNKNLTSNRSKKFKDYANKAKEFGPEAFAQARLDVANVFSYLEGLPETTNEAELADRVRVSNEVSALQASLELVESGMFDVPSGEIVTVDETPEPIGQKPGQETPPETPKTKQPQGKKADKTSDKTPPVEEQDPDKRILDLILRRMDLTNRILFKTGEGSQLTVRELGIQIEDIEADITAYGGKPPSKVLNRLNNLKKVREQMVARIEAEDKRLAAAIEAKENPVAEEPEADEVADEKEPEERSSLEQLIAATLGKAGAMAGKKVETKKAAKKAARKPEVIDYPVTHPTYGGFRSQVESDLFESWVEGGYLVSNLVEYGFEPRNVEGISLAFGRKGNDSYQVDTKKRLLAAVTERYPLVPVPEGTPTRMSPFVVGNMDSSGNALIPLPMINDAEGNAVSGFFTNDPRVTAQQLNLGKKVFIPKALREDPSFKPNPSIDYNKRTGEVTVVRRFENDKGVRGAGDITASGTTDYTPTKIKHFYNRASIFAEPRPELLGGAAPTPAKRVGVAYADHVADMMAEGSSIYRRFDPERDDDGQKDTQVLNTYGDLLTRQKALSVPNAEMTMLVAQAHYMLQLKEYGLAMAIQKALGENDINSVEARTVTNKVLAAMVMPDMTHPKPTQAARLIKKNYPFIKGEDAGMVLFNFGKFIHSKLDDKGEFALGTTKNFMYLVYKHSLNTVLAETRKGEQDRRMKTTSIDEKFDNFGDAADALMGLVGTTGDLDIIAGAVPWEQTTTDLLAAAIRTDDELKQLLVEVINGATKLNLAPDTAPETILDLTNKMTFDSAGGNSQLEIALRTSPKGRRIAALLADMGWLAPARPGGAILSPLMAELATEEERSMSVYRMAKRDNPELDAEPVSTEAAYVQLARLAAAHPDVLAMRPEITLLPWEVKVLNRANESRKAAAEYRVQLAAKTSKVADYIARKQGINITAPETTGAYAQLVTDPELFDGRNGMDTSWEEFIQRAVVTRNTPPPAPLAWDTSPDWEARAAAVEQERAALEAQKKADEAKVVRAAKRATEVTASKNIGTVAEMLGVTKPPYQLSPELESAYKALPRKDGVVETKPETDKEIIAYYRSLREADKARTNEGPRAELPSITGESPVFLKFSRTNDVRATAEMARELNNAEIAELGLVSNSPASVIAALEQIAKTGTRSHKLVAKVLLSRSDLIRNVKFLIGDLNDPRFAGAFMRESNLVVLNLSGHNGRGVADVILHEYLHAITMNGMLGPLNAKQRAAMARITQLRTLTAARARSMGMDTNQFTDALNDDIEFLAYTLTDPSFQSLVTAATPPAQRSLLARIIDTILEFFGVARDKAMSDAVMEVLDFTKMISSPTTFSLSAKRAATRRGMAMADGLSEVAAFAAIRKQLNGEMQGVQFSTKQPQYRIDEKVLGDGSTQFTVYFANEEVDTRVIDADMVAEVRESLNDKYFGEATAEDIAALTDGFDGDIRFARGRKTSDQDIYAEELQDAILGIALTSNNDIPDKDGWLYRDGSFFPVEGEEGNALGTHRESILPLLEERHPEDIARIVAERGWVTIYDANLVETYEIAMGLGYARIVGQFDTIYVEAVGELSGRQKAALRAAGENTGKDVLRDLGAGRIRQYVTIFSPSNFFSPGSETGSGDLALDPVSEIESMLPPGVTLEEDMDMRGEASVRFGETSVRVNPTFLARRIAGLSADRARMVLRSLLNHELAHIAADRVVSTKDLADIAKELGESRLAEIAEDYYSATTLTGQALADRIAADRKSGDLSDVMLAAEWYRMELTRGVFGSTSEQDVTTLRANPTLLGPISRALKAFIGELTRLFQANPTPATAAAISKGQRLLRNLAVDGVESLDVGPAGTDSDIDALASVLSGNDPVDDRVSYSVAVASHKAGTLDKMTEKLRLYNLPEKLRRIMDVRSGNLQRLVAETLNFRRDFDKMRDAAIAGGVSMDSIRDIIGSTAPPLKRADLKAIEDQLLTFAKGLDSNLSQGKRDKLIEEEREILKASKRREFGDAFRARQRAAEDSIEAAGFGDLVAKARVFRADLNKYKADVGFDESNDVYLTRTFKFFTTEGWSKLARIGGKGVIDGKEVDFDLLRATAAESYLEEVMQEVAAETARGITVTDAEIDARVLAKLDDYLETLADLNASVDLKVSDGIRKDLNRLKPKSDIDASFLQLLGEHDDPLFNGINTLHRVGLMSANQKFRDEFASTALSTGLASRRPQEGYEMVYAPNMVNTVGPLAGLYFAKNVAGVLHETFGAGRSGFDSNSTQMINKVWNGVSRASGIAILTSTKLGVGYWVRNSLGVPILSAAQGVLINPFSAQTRASFVDTVKGSFQRLPTDEARRERILRLIELNIINDQSQGRVVSDLLRGFVATPENDMQEIIADLEEARATKDAGGVLKRMAQKGYFKGLRDIVGDKFNTGVDFLGALDSAIDAFGKVNMFDFELDVIERHYGDTMTAADREVLAAKKVKATMPGHTQVVDAVKSFQRNPLAAVFVPFARFKSEIFRTMTKTIPLALDEIKEGGLMAQRGVRRLAGFTATLAAGGTVIGTIATVIFRALAGEDEEDDEVVDKDGKVRKLSTDELAALREALPVWQRGHSLFAQMLPGGKLQYVDMTYVLPHSQLTDMVSIVAEGIQTGKGVDASRLASYIGNEILGAQIAATALKETLTNRDDFGQPIYLETDSTGMKFGRMMMHYAKGAATPQVAKKGYEAFRSGQQNTKEMVIGEFLGVRTRTETLADIESRGFRNLKASLDEAVGIIGKASGSRNMDQGDIDKLVDRHQDALNQTQRRMSLFMHAMKQMGSTDRSLGTSAKFFKFSDDTLVSARDGYRIAWRPNEAWVRKAYLNAERGGEQDPREKVDMILQSVRRKQDRYWVTDGGYGFPAE